MSHNPEIREKLAERIKKEKEQKFRPAYLPDEEFDKAEIENPKNLEGKKARRHSWRERLGISNRNLEYEDNRAISLESLITCKECGKEATENNQKFCELCGSKL